MKYLVSFFIALIVTTSSYAMLSEPILNLRYDSIVKRALPDLKNVNWKVGDFQERRVKKGSLQVATVKSWVDREEGNAIWLVNDVKIILKKKEVHEALIDRKTGEILKYVKDGEEKDPPDATELEDCQDVDEKRERVKVPAGTFKSTRTIIRCPEEVVAIWVADKGVNMDGHVKQALLDEDEDPKKPDYVVELVKFGRK